MERKEFNDYPKSDRSENNTRCYFQWGWGPTSTLDLYWNKIVKPLDDWDGITNEFKDWCCENINTRWTFHTLRHDNVTFYFEDEGAAFLFKLTWG